MCLQEMSNFLMYNCDLGTHPILTWTCTYRVMILLTMVDPTGGVLGIESPFSCENIVYLVQYLGKNEQMKALTPPFH